MKFNVLLFWVFLLFYEIEQTEAFCQQLFQCLLTTPSVFYRVLRAQMEEMANPDSLAPLAPLAPLDSEE